MKPVQACSICGGAIVGFGNDAWPVNDDRCCDQCNAERVIPTPRLRERDAKRESSNGGGLQMIDLNDIEDDSFLAINATDFDPRDIGAGRGDMLSRTGQKRGTLRSEPGAGHLSFPEVEQERLG